MRYFCLIGIGFIAALVPYSGLFILQLGLPPTPSALRIAEWYRYKLEIAARKQPPRIVTIAGSNGLYGISSELIEERIGMPALNFSTHGTITLDYLFYKAREVLRPGDVALLALEYRFYYPKEVATLFSEFILGFDPAYVLSLPWQERIFWFASPSMPTLTSHFFKSHRRRQSEEARVRAEVRDELNEFGDYRKHRPENRRPDQVRALNRVEPLPAIIHWYLSGTPEVWEQIGAFARWCERNQVLLLATFPSVVDFPDYHSQEANATAEKMVAMYHSLGIRTLGKPQDFMMPKVDFYDTVYHLNEQGMRKRTEKLLPLIAEHLKTWVKGHRAVSHEN